MPNDILNPSGVRTLFEEQKPDVALKAIEAAIQYQGLRGYQQALKNGEAADKAMAKYGPMIFRKTPQAMGPAIRAMTPPAMTPYQKSQANLAREKFDYSRTNTAAMTPSITEIEPGVRAVRLGPNRYQMLPGQKEPVITETSKQIPNPDYTARTKTPFVNTTNRTVRGVSPKPAAAPAAAKGNEVVRKLKDGRRAIFNADTKEFLRYAE